MKLKKWEAALILTLALLITAAAVHPAVTAAAAPRANWWSIVFPPICMSAVGEELSVPATGLDGEGAADGVYEIRFKTIELLEDAVNFLSGS